VGTVQNVIIFLSLMFQIAAAVIAVQLFAITGRSKAWLLITTALFMMCLRRVIPIYYDTNLKNTFLYVLNEIIGLGLSVCIFFGVLGIKAFFLYHTEAEKQLEESFRYSRNLLESSLDPLVTINQDGKITDANIAAEEATGCPREILIGSDFCSYFTDPSKAEEGYHEALKRGTVKDFPLSIRNKNGKITDVIYNASLYQNKRGETAGVFAAARDITERKATEEKIASLLADKELILKEVHHRIKNNMNTIYGILSLQAGTLTNQSAIDALNDAGTRVQSMQLLYDKLYHSSSFNELSLKEYLVPLIDDIIVNFPNAKSVTVHKNIGDFVLDAKKLQSLGILVNELLTNIMKYAFTGRTDGVISVTAGLENALVTLIIADNGNGMPQSVNFEQSTGFGLLLVNALTEQVGGIIRIERGEGTRIVLEFHR
jgi:PAS domain S-box-containing protein